MKHVTKAKAAARPRQPQRRQAKPAAASRSIVPGNGPTPTHAHERIVHEARQHANGDLLQLLLSYVLPFSTYPVRHSDPLAARPTALGKPWAQLDAPWFNRDGPAAGYPSNYPLDVQIYIERHDPREFLMYIDTTRARLVKDGAGQNDNASVYYWRTDGPNPTRRLLRAGDWFNPCVALHASGYQQHGTTLYAKQFGDMSGLLTNVPLTGSSWNPTTITIDNYTGTFASTNTYVFVLRSFSMGGYRDEFFPLAGNGTAQLLISLTNVNVPKVSYLNVGYRGMYVTATGPAATDPTGIELGFYARECVDGVAVRPLPGLEANEPIIDELRILGQALMYTNDASDAFRAGKRAQYQAGGAVPPESFFLSSTPYANVASNQGAESEDLVEGAYSWRRPGGVRDWDMVPFDGPSDNAGNGLYFGTAPSTADYLVIAVQAPLPGAAAAGTATAQVGRLTYGCGVEYETEDTWRPIAPPSLDSTRYAAAMPALRNIVQHTTNKGHFSLGKMVRGALSILKAARKPAASVLAAMPHPYAQAAATGLGLLDHVL